MRRTILVVLVLVAVAAMAVTAAAAPKGGDTSKALSCLELTPDQQAAMAELREQMLSRLNALRDEAKALDRTDRKELMKQARAIRHEFREAARGLLTPEQLEAVENCDRPRMRMKSRLRLMRGGAQNCRPAQSRG